MSDSIGERGSTPVSGTVLVIGFVVRSTAVGAFVLPFGADLGGVADAAVDVSPTEPDDGQGFAVGATLGLARAGTVTVTAAASDELRCPVDGNGNTTDDGTEPLESAADSTMSSDGTTQIDGRPVAGERWDRRAAVFDRTVTI